jgi:hypothetical protein
MANGKHGRADGMKPDARCASPQQGKLPTRNCDCDIFAVAFVAKGSHMKPIQKHNYCVREMQPTKPQVWCLSSA